MTTLACSCIAVVLQYLQNGYFRLSGYCNFVSMVQKKNGMNWWFHSIGNKDTKTDVATTGWCNLTETLSVSTSLMLQTRWTSLSCCMNKSAVCFLSVLNQLLRITSRCNDWCDINTKGFYFMSLSVTYCNIKLQTYSLSILHRARCIWVVWILGDWSDLWCGGEYFNKASQTVITEVS